MKICVISSTVFSVPLANYGGLEQLAWQRAEGLAKKGHEVTLIAPEGSHCDYAQLVTPSPPGRESEEQWYAKYWKLLPSFDCIIDDSWQKHSCTLKLEGRLKAPILGVCHAPVHTMFAELPPEKIISFVCISQDMALHFKGLFSRDCRWAHNGIDLDHYKPLGILRSGRFLFLARFSTVKGPDLALEACQQTGAGLDLVGDLSITNEPDYFNKCMKMCDGKQLRMVGPASRGECVWWFSQAHCLLHPNQRFREPFGLAPVEAMACGCPVVAWDFGAMRETVKHGETGWLVKSMDELVRAIRVPVWGHMSQLNAEEIVRKRCREQAANYSIQRFIDRYEELCIEAIDSGGW